MTHPLRFMYRNAAVEAVALPPGITWPVQYAVIRLFKNNHTFGMVRRNWNGTPRPHQGWDFHAPDGYRCYAIADGRITHVRSTPGYGHHVILEFRHDPEGDGQIKRFYAAYCHLSRVDVEVGQVVKMGQVLGLTGSTGNAHSMRGPDKHLHFEIRTRPIPMRGLNGRISPIEIFGAIPMSTVMMAAPE